MTGQSAEGDDDKQGNQETAHREKPLWAGNYIKKSTRTACHENGLNPNCQGDESTGNVRKANRQGAGEGALGIRLFKTEFKTRHEINPSLHAAR